MTPQMASIDDIVRGFHPKPGVRYTYSAFNERGMERARSFTPPLSGRIREFNLSFTMCDVLRSAMSTELKRRKLPDGRSRSKRRADTA